MIKTLTLDGLTSVTIKQSAYDMARFCWVNNRSGSDIFMSCTDPQCTENADGVKHIPAGEHGMLDTESYETLYIKGSGMVNIETSPFAVCPFGEGKKGGGASLSGSAAYTINNAVDYPLMGLNLYGKSTQDGTPSPDNPVDIVSVGDNGSVTITVDNGNSVSVTANITTSLPLCGIPVESGGNYTDKNGQQWICDMLIYNADGTGKIIKNTEIFVFDGSNDEKWINAYTTTEFTNDFRIQYSKLNGTKAESIQSSSTLLYCNRLQYNNTIWDTDVSGCQIASIGDFILRMPSSIIGGNDVAAFKSWLANNPLTIVYQIAPQEIPLTAADVSALMQLKTYSGVTNISNSDNAEMDVKYCTNSTFSEYVMPVITNMQAQIDELKSAVLSLGGNI